MTTIVEKFEGYIKKMQLLLDETTEESSESEEEGKVKEKNGGPTGK